MCKSPSQNFENARARKILQQTLQQGYRCTVYIENGYLRFNVDWDSPRYNPCSEDTGEENVASE